MARTRHGLPGIYNSTAITLDNEEGAALALDVNDNVKTTLATALSSDIDSVTNYPVSCTMTVVDTSVNSTTVSAAPAVLLGIYVNTVLSAHTVLITDAAVTKLTLPASMAAGTKIDCHSALFATSLIVNPDDISTGEIVVFWRAV